MTLSETDKVQFSEWFEQEGRKVFKKVLEAKILELGLNALNSRTEVHTAELRGQMQGIDWMYKQMKQNHSEVEGLENKKK